jgi:hypothetical protein
LATPREIYNASIRQLPPIERLRLAALILNHLTSPGPNENQEVDNDETSELAAYLLKHAGRRIPLGDKKS